MLWLRLGRDNWPRLFHIRWHVHCGCFSSYHLVGHGLRVGLPSWPAGSAGCSSTQRWIITYYEYDIWYIYIYINIYIYITIVMLYIFVYPQKKYSNFNCTSKIWSQECKKCHREVAFRSGYAKPFRTQPLHQMPRLHHRQSLVFNSLNQHERWKKHVIHYVYRWIWKWYG
jgi:hypothetical protein